MRDKQSRAGRFAFPTFYLRPTTYPPKVVGGPDEGREGCQLKGSSNWKSAVGAPAGPKRYKTTQGLPRDQRFGLIAQMQRAAVSVPANIAEGFKRRGRADKVHFYNIAQGSLEELRYYFILCRDLEYKVDYESLVEQAERVGRMLTGLINSVRV